MSIKEDIQEIKQDVKEVLKQRIVCEHRFTKIEETQKHNKHTKKRWWETIKIVLAACAGGLMSIFIRSK